MPGCCAARLTLRRIAGNFAIEKKEKKNKNEQFV